ncbi:MAG: hypothetical protein CL470_04440 [Acidimicrobiaceae bacterium]|nr:hypothetical protein [Acidimicrobiaceae bacterium]|tara:strand:+ start:1743 stop:2678 length:936 start_codon:yes stop_codon:yes gene_type:complete
MTLQQRLLTNVKNPFVLAHLVFAGMYFVFVLLGEWAKRREANYDAFEFLGGAGFGILGVATGVALCVLALMRLGGYSKVLPGLGVEHLTLALGLFATVNVFAFIFGWLPVLPVKKDPAGTGWALVAAYWPASFIPQLGILSLARTRPNKGIRPLSNIDRNAVSVLALVASVGVIVFPFMTWLKIGALKLSTFDGRNECKELGDVCIDTLGKGASGPRLGYLLLIIGAVVGFAALMRLRPKGLAEPGPNMLLSHLLFGMGLTAFLVPLAMLITTLQNERLEAGTGLWLSLASGALMILISVYENHRRGAKGV